MENQGHSLSFLFLENTSVKYNNNVLCFFITGLKNTGIHIFPKVDKYRALEIAQISLSVWALKPTHTIQKILGLCNLEGVIQCLALPCSQALKISINYSWSIFGQSLWNIPIFGWGFGFGGRVQQIMNFICFDWSSRFFLVKNVVSFKKIILREYVGQFF